VFIEDEITLPYDYSQWREVTRFRCIIGVGKPPDGVRPCS